MKIGKRYLLIVFVISILVGLIFLGLTLNYSQKYDAVTFINCGKEIAHKGWKDYDMIKEPGYPVLLSPLFYFLEENTAVLIARILNIFLLAGSAIIFVLIFQVLKPEVSKKRLIIFGLIFGCSPQLITFSSLRLYSEPLTLFLNSIILFCFFKIVSAHKIFKGDDGLLFWIIGGLASGWLIMAKAFFLLYPLWMIMFGVGISIIIKRKKINFVKKLMKPIIVFLVLCYIWPFLWSLRNYFKYDHFMISIRGATTLLSHTYLVELETKDSLKWAVYQLSENLGKKLYPEEKEKMMKQHGGAYRKAEVFAQYGDKKYKNSEILAVKEWWRLVKGHPYRYVLFTLLNSLNHVFLEGIYPDIYPPNMSKAMRFLYLLNAIIFHVFYSLFIWFIILIGIIIYLQKVRSRGVSSINLNYVYLILPLLYFAIIAYHFHTEIRYLHPLFPNIYLLYCLSLNFWFDRFKIIV